MIAELLEEGLMLEAVKRGDVPGSAPAAVREIERLESFVEAALRALNQLTSVKWSREKLSELAEIERLTMPPSLHEVKQRIEGVQK